MGTRLFRCLPGPLLCPPILHPRIRKASQEVDIHPLFLFILIVILGHLQIYFSLF